MVLVVLVVQVVRVELVVLVVLVRRVVLVVQLVNSLAFKAFKASLLVTQLHVFAAARVFSGAQSWAAARVGPTAVQLWVDS